MPIRRGRTNNPKGINQYTKGGGGRKKKGISTRVKRGLSRAGAPTRSTNIAKLKQKEEKTFEQMAWASGKKKKALSKHMQAKWKRIAVEETREHKRKVASGEVDPKSWARRPFSGMSVKATKGKTKKQMVAERKLKKAAPTKTKRTILKARRGVEDRRRSKNTAKSTRRVASRKVRATKKKRR